MSGSDRAGQTAEPVGPAFAAADLKEAFSRFRKDQMTDHAAGLVYYSLLSLFPALLFAVAALGVFGQESLITDAAEYLSDAGAPQETVDAVTRALDSALSQRGTAVGALVIGLATALWGASGAFGATGRALNVVYRVEEGRGMVRKKATDLASTLIVLVLVNLTFVLVFLGGGLAADVLGLIGLDSLATLWQIVRWPAALCVAILIYAIVYYAAPNVEIRSFKLITPGSLLGVLLWMLASALFFLYVSNFSTYSATYGSFAAVVILLIWLWITNSVLLFGAELNAVAELRRKPSLGTDYKGPPLPEKVPADSE